MKISMIRWLSCIGFGLALGFIAAQKDLIPRSRADLATPATGPENLVEPSTCCDSGMKKEDLLTHTSNITSPPRSQRRLFNG